MMKRQVLIVEDNDINMRTLQVIMEEEYEVIKASNGYEALEVLSERSAMISLIILDLVMPKMDGYEVLSKIGKSQEFQKIPVIVVTGSNEEAAEERALEMGAQDVIFKPYEPRIIQNRVRNTIKLREQAAIVNASQTDALTGLMNRLPFFECVKEKIKEKPSGYYILAAFDIDGFRVINDQYGTAKGDSVLRQIAALFYEYFMRAEATMSRINADNFAILYPKEFSESSELNEIRRRVSLLDGTIMPLTYSIGRYYVEDTEIEPSAMYDRAVMAKELVKGKYDNHIGIYEEGMREKLIEEQEIISEMKQALFERQFEVWYQPQFNHATGELIGAEALVRWRHPKKGMIRPDKFISVFDRNGFIYELDKYVWECSCQFLCLIREKNGMMLPISVNVAQHDINQPDMVDFMFELITKYNIPIEFFHVEITETAFALSNEQTLKVVNGLKQYGFLVEIDDFGSGYSSLNTLKDVPADVIKLDMKFLRGKTNNDRGGNILESVVRMARWLGMVVIAEGVELVEQANFLKSIGCSYVQGYLYSKPIPREEMLELMESKGYIEKMTTMESVETYDNEAFWDPQSIETIIFNSFVGGACVYEYSENKFEVIRVNERFTKIIGGTSNREADALVLDWMHFMTGESRELGIQMIKEAIDSGEEVNGEVELVGYRVPNESIFIHIRQRVIASAGSHYLFYSVIEDMTEQRRAERKEKSLMRQLDIILSNMNGGALAYNYDEAGKVKMLFANQRFYEQRGFTKEQYAEEVKDVFSILCEDDVDMLAKRYKENLLSGKKDTVIYEIIRRDKKRRWIRGKVSTAQLTDSQEKIQIVITDDITREYEAVIKEKETDSLMHLLLDNIASGITAVTLNGDKVEYLFMNDQYCNMMGYTKDEFNEEVTDVYSLFHTDDRDMVYEEVHKIKPGDAPLTLEARLHRRDGSYRKIRMLIVCMEYSGKMLQLTVFEDITVESREKEQQKELLENLPCGAGIFALVGGQLEIIYLNKRYWSLVGRQPDKKNPISVLESIQLEDRAILPIIIQRVLVTGQDQECELHILHGNGSYVPFVVRGNIKKHRSGRQTLYVTYTPIQEDAVTFRRMLPVALETMMAASADYSFIKDRALHYVCASRAFALMAGYEDERDIIGKTDYDLFEKSIADRFRSEDKRLLATGKSLVNYVEGLPLKNGANRYSSTSKYVLRDTANNIIGLYGIGRDITEDKEAFARLRMLTDTIPGGLATLEITSLGIRPVYLSDGAFNIAKYKKKEDISSINPLNYICEEDLTEVYKQLEKLKANPSLTVDCVCRVICKDGTKVWVNIRGNETERNEHHAIVNIVMFDVNEQIIVEDRLRNIEIENRRRFEHEFQLRKELIKNAEFYFQVNLTTGVVEEYEVHGSEIVGMQKGCALDQSVLEKILSAIYPEDVEKVREILLVDSLKNRYRDGERTISVTYRRKGKTGEYRYVQMEVFMLEKVSSEEIFAFLYCRDIDTVQKNHLAIATILDEDIESIFFVDVTTGVATISHMLEEKNYVHVYNEFLFEQESLCCGESIVYEQDKEDFLHFYNIANLLDMLKMEEIVTVTYRICDNGVISRKQAKAYFLNEQKNTIILTRRDISKLYEEEQRQKLLLQEAVDAANRASHAKSDFLSNMSHDIRTPLNAILAFSDMELINDADEQKLMEYLHKINSSGAYLLGIINDVLDMSRIERNRLVLNREPYSMEAFENAIRNVVGELSKNKGVELFIDIGEMKKRVITVDSVRFNQIFINLLSNAVKFTPTGGKVELIAEVLKNTEEDQENLRFIVRDNGIGMSEEFIPHAFESFSQEYRRDAKQNAPGTGLGLSIVSDLVKMMDGTITLQSALNQGTTFTIIFPLEWSEQLSDTTAEEPQACDYSVLTNARILVAEDNEVNAEIAAALLEKHECSVEIAENGEAAYQKFMSSNPGYYQMILMDLRMPIMNGLEATRIIRSLDREDAKTIPIIAMTADAFAEDENSALRAGMNAHIGKPVCPAQLYSVCSTFLKKL